MRIATPNSDLDPFSEDTGARRPAAANFLTAGIFLLGLAACQPGDSSSMTDATSDNASDAAAVAGGAGGQDLDPRHPRSGVREHDVRAVLSVESDDLGGPQGVVMHRSPQGSALRGMGC